MNDTLIRFLRPLYQDLDGVSHFDEVERVARIARSLHSSDDPSFERLLLFHRLGRWLDKVGNLSRAALATGISEADLRRTSASIARLDAPANDAERALAAAILIDAAGPRGLAERFAHARREGRSVIDMANAAMNENEVPEWMSEEARAMLAERRRKRDEFCEAVIGDV
jgi:hypothetical protein